MQVIYASSPGRCGIIGNPTDGYGGTVISCSIEERAYAEIRDSECLRVVVSGDRKILNSEEDFILTGDKFDIPKILLKHLNLTDAKIEMRCWSEIPLRSGLAGSSATLSAIFGALSAFKGLSYNPYQIAESIHKIEKEILKIQCGYQDHYMTVFGGLNYMDFRTMEHCKSEDAVYATIEPLTDYVSELPFVLALTGIERFSGNILKPIRERWEQGDSKVIKGYESVAQLARLGKKALLLKKWDELGDLMNQNHKVQQDIGASGEANDALIEVARKAGAEGAKLAGAGGGGTIIALATNPEPVITALKTAGAKQILFPKPSPGLKIEIK